MYSILFAKAKLFFHNSAHFSKNAHVNSVTNFSSVRDSSTMNKYSVMDKFIKHKIISSLEIALSNIPGERTCTFELADVHQCSKVDFPCRCFVCLFITSFHSLSTAAFASGINIAWCEISFACTLGFRRQASLRERFPESSEPFVTLCSLMCIFFTRRILSHRYAVSRNETTCASFHLENKKSGEELSFQVFSSEWIRVPCCVTTQNSVFPLQYQYKWILLQTLWLLLIWNNGFPYACSGMQSFAWNSSFSIRLFLFLSSLSCFPNSHQTTSRPDYIIFVNLSRIGYILSDEFRSIT